VKNSNSFTLEKETILLIGEKKNLFLRDTPVKAMNMLEVSSVWGRRIKDGKQRTEDGRQSVNDRNRGIKS
jgi:hypothetical protein